MITDNQKFQGMHRARVVEVDGEDKEYGAVRVFIPDVMSESSDDTIDPDSSGILAYPGNNSLGGYNDEDKNKDAVIQVSVNIPLKNSWVWVWFETGDTSRAFYGSAFQYRNSKLPPENTSVKEPHKVHVIKAQSGRSIIICDSADKARVEITGKRRKQKGSDSAPQGSGGVYDVDGNMNTILMDERVGKEKILMKSHKGDFFKFDIAKRKLHINFADDVVITSGKKIVIQAKKDVNISSSKNVNVNAQRSLHVNGGFGSTVTGGITGVSVSSIGPISLAAAGPILEMSLTYTAVDSILPHWVQSGIANVLNPIKDAIMNSGIFKAIMSGLAQLQAIIAVPLNMINTVTGTITSAINQVTGAITTVVSTITDTISTITDGIMGAIDGVMSGITGAIDGVMGSIDNVIGSITAPLNEVIGGITGAVGEITGAITGITDGITGAISGITDSLTGITDGITGAISGITDSLTGITDGIMGSIGDITGQISGITGQITDSISGITSSITNIQGELMGSFSEITGAFDELNGLTDQIAGIGDVLSGELSSVTDAFAEIGDLSNSIGDAFDFTTQLESIGNITDSIATLKVGAFSEGLTSLTDLSGFDKFGELSVSLTAISSTKLTDLMKTADAAKNALEPLAAATGFGEITTVISTISELSDLPQTIKVLKAFKKLKSFAPQVSAIGKLVNSLPELKKFHSALPAIKTVITSPNAMSNLLTFSTMLDRCADLSEDIYLQSRIDELRDKVLENGREDHLALAEKLTRFSNVIGMLYSMPSIRSLAQSLKNIHKMLSNIKPDKVDDLTTGMSTFVNMGVSTPAVGNFSKLTDVLVDAFNKVEIEDGVLGILGGGLSNTLSYKNASSKMTAPLFTKHTSILSNLKGKIIGSTSSEVLNSLSSDIIASEVLRGISNGVLQPTILDNLIGSNELREVATNCIEMGYLTSDVLPSDNSSVSYHILTSIENGEISPIVIPIILDNLKENHIQTVVDKLHQAIPSTLLKIVNDGIDPLNIILHSLDQVAQNQSFPDADAILSEENVLSAAINHVKSKGLDSLMKMIPKEPTSGSRD